MFIYFIVLQWQQQPENRRPHLLVAQGSDFGRHLLPKCGGFSSQVVLSCTWWWGGGRIRFCGGDCYCLACTNNYTGYVGDMLKSLTSNYFLMELCACCKFPLICLSDHSSNSHAQQNSQTELILIFLPTQNKTPIVGAFKPPTCHEDFIINMQICFRLEDPLHTLILV